MFFNDWIQRRLASLLNPWLLQEPELELKLGFLRSHGVAKNLTFDASILNHHLLDESSLWSFKDVTVEQLSLRVSYWSVPTFLLQVHGVHITLSLGELKEGRGLRTRQKSTNTDMEDKKKVLEEIDPEVRDIHLQVQFPISNDSFRCLWEVKELNAESLYTDEGNFLRGLVSSIFTPLKEISLGLDVTGFEISLKRRDCISCLIRPVDLVTRTKFKDLQLRDFNLNVPELSFSIAPEELPIILAFHTLTSYEFYSARTGRHLWNIAASRISSLISTPRSTMHRLIVIVCLWLQYVNAYETLLLLVGYPVDSVMKRSAVKMSQDNTFSVAVKKQWRMVSEIENKLPAEAIAKAWRITRYRAALNIQQAKNHSSKSLVKSHFCFSRRVLVPLELICGVLCRTFRSLINLLLQIFLDDHPCIDEHSGVVSDDSSTQSCYSISMGIISLFISPIQSLAGGNPISDIGSSSLDLLSFCVLLDGLFLMYTESICDDHVSLSCGHLKVMSSSPTEDGLKNNKTYMKGHWKKKFDYSKTILWAEPAKVLNFPENATTDETSVSPLWNHLGEMGLNWKNSCTQFGGSMTQFLENPWILCEIQRFVTDRSLKNLHSGFLKCSLMVGKLNFLLDYPSLLSIAVVLRQIQHALRWTHSSGRAKVLLPTPIANEIPPPISWDSRCKSYVSEIEKTMLKMLPQKHVQIVVFIAGPLFQISLRKEGFHDEHTNESHISTQHGLQLALDVNNIEVAVWPTLSSDFVASTDWQGLDDERVECLRFKEPQIVNIPMLDNEFYKCQGQISMNTYLKLDGLKAYLDDSATNQKYQIIMLNPTTIKLSCLRKDVHSFSASIVAFSAALDGMATGLFVLIYIDELFVLVEEIVGLLSAVSRIFSGLHLDGGECFQELMRQEMACADSKREAMLTRTKGVSLILTKALFVVHSTFELSSIDMVLCNSRRGSDINHSAMTFDASNGRKLAMHGLPDYGILISVHKKSLEFCCEGGEVEVIVDLSGIRSVIFRDHSEIWRTSDQFQHINLAAFSELRNALPSRIASNAAEGSTSVGEISYVVGDSPSAINIESYGSASNRVALASAHWLTMNITISEIYVARLSVKKLLIGAHKSSKLEFSLSIGREFQMIACQIQGGSLFLETTALAMFVDCFASYLRCVGYLLHVVTSSEEHMVTETGEEDMAVQDGHPSREQHNSFQHMMWEQLEVLTIDVSQFSLLLVTEDESGGLKELQFEADFHVKLELQTNEIQIPHFSPITPSNSSSHSVHGDPAVAFQHTDEIHSVLDDENFSRRVSRNESAVDNSEARVLHLSRQNYILKQLGASIAVENPVQGEEVRPELLNQGWVGSGSITGFDMTISLPEIQMLLSTAESLSGIFSKETSGDVKQMHCSGAIVAIQDVHQHMYMTVEGLESKYSLVGTIHYSLVGDRALFRVKYQNQKRWKSSVLWFSLISLYAKSDSGEPLQLNYRSGSGFVDISSTNDGGHALWRILSCKPDSYEGDIEPDSCNFLGRNTFYLVNKKIDRAVAFVDGVPEFVSKPGNPFKLKVFSDFPPARAVVSLDSCSLEATRNSLHHNSHVNKERASGKTENLPRIDIIIDKIILTVVHELPDTRETFPLLQASTSTDEFIVQILFAKARVISTLSFVLYYFDAQSNLWRDFIHPVEICVFYRSQFQIEGSEIGWNRVPVHFYAKMKEVPMR
ncbi:vacuolar protein sorting-associated protein, putative [Actinidia rufa]|uniref:Vacuolar protein sorting-associated protein, putative n=1 Tax=Actinidia rufa TaxID=165716 RepID=A0A7J0F5E4_9ERIC|nr:vacuolar protein sorting-associated protein, putative [Actinidia rufa]